MFFVVFCFCFCCCWCCLIENSVILNILRFDLKRIYFFISVCFALFLLCFRLNLIADLSLNLYLLSCCLTSTEARWPIRDGNLYCFKTLFELMTPNVFRTNFYTFHSLQKWRAKVRECMQPVAGKYTLCPLKSLEHGSILCNQRVNFLLWWR